MTQEIVYDSDILIDHLRGHLPAKNVIEKVKNRKIVAYISSITEAELLAGKDLDNENKREIVEELIKKCIKIIVNNDIAQKAGEFRRRYRVEMPDAIIAATAFHQKCRLWTKNKKDFEMIKEIEVEEPY